MIDKLLTVEEVAKILNKTPGTIIADRCRNPESLPRAVKFPRSRTVFFLESDVQAHIMKSREPEFEPEPTIDHKYTPRRPKEVEERRTGRPTNTARAERLGRQREAFRERMQAQINN